MERIRNLDLYQKCILALLLLMFVGFTTAYVIVYAQEGFRYDDAFLKPSFEAGETIYSGKLDGKEIRFTVSADKAVTFHCGEKIYGPYTIREDPSAVPKDSSVAEHLTGIEICWGEKVIFRGGVFATGGEKYLFHEDVGFANVSILVNGTHDPDGNRVDRMEPSASTIYAVAEGPDLTRRGDLRCWFSGVFASIAAVVSILFADELFRWDLSFRIRDSHRAEPSEWELFGRYIGWTIITIAALVIYFVGLMV